MTTKPAIFLDGRIVPYEEATVHMLTTAFKYGACVFEGLRGYWSPRQGQLYLFRVQEHLQRLQQSARISRMTLPYSNERLTRALVELCRQNQLQEDIHIRILVFVNDDNGGLASTGPISTAIATMPQGRYPEVAGKPGLDVCISSWRRIDDQALPARVKAIANYQNSRLALLQARQDGYDDAILLDARGKISEGPGYNFFMVRDDRVLTPPVTSGILEGVTRDTLIKLCAQRGHRVLERDLDRSEAYAASEAFFCGSSKEVTPIASVDGHRLGDACPGPWTAWLKQVYMETVRGERPPLEPGWLLPVYD